MRGVACSGKRLFRATHREPGAPSPAPGSVVCPMPPALTQQRTRLEDSDPMTATLEPTGTKEAKATAASSPAEVIRKAKDAGVQVVDVRFTDLPGTWQHFSIPLKELSEELFTEGIGFDGSWIRVSRCRRCRSPATCSTR